MNFTIADGWTIFGYNGPSHNTEKSWILVASKNTNVTYEIYKDFKTINRFICFKDDKKLFEADTLSKLMYKVDKRCYK